jgi:peptide/nickel transport system substrate-binding protein
VKFHNGDLFTADDVVFSLARAKGDFGVDVMSSRIGTDLKNMIESVRKTGQYEVQIKTKEPFATFLRVLATPLVAIVPEKVLRGKSQPFFTDDPVGTGPFKFKEWKRGQYMEFERYDGYVTSYRAEERLPYLDGVRTLIIQDEAAYLGAIQAGQVHLTPRFPSLTTRQAQLLKRARGEQLVISKIRDLSLVVCEIGMLSEPFKSNPKLRQAVWMALDRQTIAQKIYEGLLEPGVIVDPAVFPQASLSSKELEARDCYLQRCAATARGILAEAVPQKGFAVKVYAGLEASTETGIAQVLTQNLRDIGLQASFEPQQGAAWGRRLVQADFQIIAGIAPAARFVHPLELLVPAFQTGGGVNYGRWSDPELDALLYEAARSFDASKANQLVVAAQRRILQQSNAATIPVGATQGLFAQDARVKGFRFNPTMYESWRLDTAWLSA